MHVCALDRKLNVSTMVKPTHNELAGKWEMIKDTKGDEKRGLCMAIYPMGPCLVSACAL